MDWLDLYRTLASEMEAISPAVPDIGDISEGMSGAADALLDMETLTAEHVDAAVEEYARTLRWPPLTHGQRTMLVLRLENASALCFLFSGAAAAGMPPAVPVDLPSVIRWLLLPAWHNHGFPTIHDTCERLLRRARQSNPT